MIDAEHIHDALTLLPDDLLEPVDALRQKRRIPWKSITATAACLCLVAGLWLLNPGAASKGSANGSAPGDKFSGVCDSVDQESLTQTPLVATVMEVAEDRIIVLPGETHTDIATPVTVLLTDLEEILTLTKGQRINIYCRGTPDLTKPLLPYRIEIKEDVS
jgi:hypothetical protein